MSLLTPQVSVVMSVYNGARHLDQAIKSILDQSGVEFEFIIINDGSTDESGVILERYNARDDRIRVIEQGNQGLTLALIRGCSEAKGKYIARQDADDISMPGRLEKLVEAICSEEGIVMASSWAHSIGPKGETLNTLKRPSDSVAATHALLHERTGPPGHGSVMFSKSVYEKAGGYRRNFYYGQDSDLWLRLGGLGRVIYYPEILYAFRYEPGSISTMSRLIQKQFGEFGQACHRARLNGEPEDEFLAAADALREQVLSRRRPNCSRRRWNTASGYYLIASSLEKNKEKGALKYFFKAATSHPLFFRAWVRILLSLAARG